MASLTATPNPGVVGKPITFVGDGFTPATEVVIEVEDVRSEIVSDAAGNVSSAAITDHATVTLTATGNAATTNTVTLAGQVYTLRSGTATLLPNEIRLGADAEHTLENIKAAVNNAAGEGTLYGLGTKRNEKVMAGAQDATTIVFYAREPGAGSNGLGATDTLANMAFGAGTFTGGVATGAKALDWRPAEEGTYTATATDGTNSASTQVRVFTAPA